MRDPNVVKPMHPRRFTGAQLVTLDQLRRLVERGYAFGHNGVTWWAERGGMGSGGESVPLPKPTMDRLNVGGCFHILRISYPLHIYQLRAEHAANIIESSDAR